MTTRPLLDPRFGFESWWKDFKCLAKRKVYKPYCEAYWIKNRLAEQASHIMLYTQWRFEQEDIQYRPGPKPFLRAGGWDEWTPAPPAPKPKDWLQEYAEHEKKAVPMPKHLRTK